VWRRQPHKTWCKRVKITHDNILQIKTFYSQDAFVLPSTILSPPEDVLLFFLNANFLPHILLLKIPAKKKPVMKNYDFKGKTIRHAIFKL
jgi:hypothetical protein